MAVGRVGNDQVGRVPGREAQRVRAAQRAARTAQPQRAPRHFQCARVEVETVQVHETRARSRQQERSRAGAGIEHAPLAHAAVLQRRSDHLARDLPRRVVETRVPAPGVAERARLLPLVAGNERVGAQAFLPRSNPSWCCAKSAASSCSGRGSAPPSARA